MEQASEKSRRQKDRYFAIAVFLLLVSSFVGVLLLWQTKENNAYRVRATALLADQALMVFGPARALLAVMEGIGDSLPQLPEIQRVGYRALAQLRERRILEGHAAQVQSVQFAPQRPDEPKRPILLTTSNDGFLRFWNFETGALIDSIYVPGARFLTARWSPDGKQLFVSARDIDAFFLVPCSSEKLRPFFAECGSATADTKRSFKQRVGGGSFSPDGRWIVTGGFNASTKLWDVGSQDLEQKKDFGRTGSFTVGAAFSPDSQRLALGSPIELESSGGDIRIFRIADLLNQADARPEKTLNRPTGGPQTSGPQTSGPRALVTSLAFHPTDPNVLLGTFQDGTTKWWNIANGEEKILRIERGMAFQGVFNNDGEWAATAHEDGIVRLWPLRAAQSTPQMLRGHQGTVYTVAYSPDGTTIASGSSDGTARIWSQQPALGRMPISATIPPAEFGAGKASARENGAGQLILSYNNTDFAVRAPPEFREPAAAGVSSSGKDAVIAPKHGRPYLFSLASKEYIVELPGRPAAWRHVGFFRDPNPAAGTPPERIIGITQDGEAYSWPYFVDLQALKQFAVDNLPFIGSERLPIRADVACRIKAKPESECPSMQDMPAQE
jgi:WD40 repeat protein